MAEGGSEESMNPVQQGQLGHQFSPILYNGQPGPVYVTNSQVTVTGGQGSERRHIPATSTPDILGNIAKSTKDIMKRTGRYVETDESLRALELVNINRRVLLIGSRGSGKTALGLHILGKLSDRTPLMLTDPDQWNLIPRPQNWGNIQSKEKYAVLIDDIVGRNTPDMNILDRWERLFDFIEPMIDSGQVVIIASSASIIVNMFRERSRFWNFFRQRNFVDIDSIDFTPSQKKEILSSITRDRHRFSKEEIEKLTSVNINPAFAACCQYFAKNENVYNRGLEFFQRPVELINDDIEELYEKRSKEYMSLIQILYETNEIPEDHNTAFTKNDSLQSITSLIPERHFTQIEFKRAADALKGTFLKYIPETDSYAFIDQMVHDAVSRNFLSKFPEIGMSLCPLHIIVEFSCISNVERDRCLVVPIQQKALARRLSLELSGGNFEYVITHTAFRDQKFIAFMNENGYFKTNDFLLAKLKFEKSVNFEHAFDIFQIESYRYLIHTSKLFSYKSKFSLIVVKGLKAFSDFLLENLLINMERYQQVIVEVLPCLCYVGDVQALLALKLKQVKPSESCLLACVAAPKESLKILKYVCQYIKPNSEMLGFMLSITLQQGYGESSLFLLNELSNCKDLSLMTRVFHHIILQCHGKEGRIFMESESGIILKKYGGKKIPWEKYLNVDHFVSKLSENVQESDANWLILLAAGSSLCSAVEKLLAVKPSLSRAKTSRSETLLHLACKDGSKEMVALILSKDIDSNQFDDSGYLALHYAVTSLYDPIEKVRLFMQKGFDMNHKTQSEKSVLHLVSFLGLDLVLCELLSICSREAINSRDDKGNTPLHLSSKCGDGRLYSFVHLPTVNQYSKCVSILLEAGAEVNIKNKRGNTALHFSAAAHAENIMECLIEKGANLNEQDEFGNPPLFMNAESVPFLISKGADVNIRNKYGNAILHVLHTINYKIEYIIFQDRKSVCKAMKLLKEMGANMNARNSMGQTCLHVSLSKLKYFDHFSECHVDENITDIFGQTVHHYFIGLSDTDLRELEPVLRMEMKNALAFYGYGAIHLSARRGHHFSLSCLIEKSKANVNLKNRKHQNALHIATEKGYWKCMNILLQNKARLNDRDIHGETPLLVASARPGFVDKVRLLLDSGAEVNYQDPESLTPLHRAVRRNLTDVVKVLSSHHTCKHDIRDGFGNIPLHTACYRDNFDMIPTLVGNVKNLSRTNEQGNTPIHLLVSKKTMQFEPYIKKNGLKASEIPISLSKQLSRRRQRLLRRSKGPSWLSMYVLKIEQPSETMIIRNKVKTKKLPKKLNETSLNDTLFENKKNGIPLSSPLDSCIVSLLDQKESEESLLDEKESCRALLIEPLKVTTSLLQQCSDVNIQNHKGNTPLHIAAFSGSWKIVKELLNNGAVIRRNFKGETPLHLAVYRDHMMTVKLLLQNGVDRESMDAEGNTPVHLAGLCGHMNVLLMLLAAASSQGVRQLKRVFKQDISKRFPRPELPSSDLIGCFDLETQNASRETVLHSAVRGGWLKMVKGLLLLGSSLTTKNNVGMSATDLAREYLKKKPSQFKTYNRMLYLLKRASESTRVSLLETTNC